MRKYIKDIFTVINDVEKDLYGEVDLTDEMIKKYVKQFILMVNVRYVALIVDENNQMVGIGVTVPTLGPASKNPEEDCFHWDG